MPAAERETGGVAVDVVGAGEVAERATRGLEPADPSELGEIVAGRESPSMIAFRLRPLAGSEPRSLAVNVVRFIPQAVLIANVEEARYRALASEDGSLLVEARFAVRNNQRSFLKVTMPPSSTVWSAKVGGRPIRPGVAERGAVLLPLEKGRAGEEAPTFVVEMVYLQRIAAGSTRARRSSRSPRSTFPSRAPASSCITRRASASRCGRARSASRTIPGPFAAGAARLVERHGAAKASALASAAAALGAAQDASKLQALVDRFRNEAGGRTVVGALPVHVTFPQFGPSMFLASELTAESNAPSIELAFRRR